MVRRLEERGHLQMDHGKPGRGHAHHYRLIGKDQPAKQLKDQPAEQNPFVPLKEIPSVERLSLDLGDKDSGSRGRRDSATSDTDFEAFYRQYPRHAKAYRTAITKKLATPEQLLAGAMRYAAERQGQDPRYTAHPATWLNAGRWADEAAKQIATTLDANGNVLPDWSLPSPDRPPPNAHVARVDAAIAQMRAKGILP
jgi:hypothetical protein